ncbi:MAG: outer membrane protein assembly factor BamD [Bryobacteraceae bacterium]
MKTIVISAARKGRGPARFARVPLRTLKRALAAVAMLGLLSSCIHKKYETPITKNTQQPDKVLFDKAMSDIEHGRYEVARIELNTLMNTYESSEFLAKAKLALADSWYREGGGNGMAQAEAEYKDFELFYPTMEESAEAQYKICMIHYRQMDKADRDPAQALRAEDECRNLLIQYPNSKHAPQAAQLLRNIQEVLGGHEFSVGTFYFSRGANPAAANRLSYLADEYPLYSGADEALWEAGKSYLKMGPRFRQNAADDFSRIVRDYPLSARAANAKQELEDLEVPIPHVNQAAADREKYDDENYKGRSLVSQGMGFLFSRPDISHAAKSGPPTMQDTAFPIPASVPKVNNNLEASAGGGGGTTDVQGSVVQDPSKLDQNKDARQNLDTKGTTAATGGTSTEPVPTNHDAELKKAREQALKKAKKNKKKNATQNAAAQNASGNATQGTQQGQGNAAPATSQQPVQGAQPQTQTTQPQQTAPPNQ